MATMTHAAFTAPISAPRYTVPADEQSKLKVIAGCVDGRYNLTPYRAELKRESILLAPGVLEWFGKPDRVAVVYSGKLVLLIPATHAKPAKAARTVMRYGLSGAEIVGLTVFAQLPGLELGTYRPMLIEPYDRVDLETMPRLTSLVRRFAGPIGRALFFFTK